MRHSTRTPSAFPGDIARYLEEVRRHPVLTRSEEQALARRARKGDTAAAQELVTANLRFVIKVCIGYRHYGLPVEDLIQEGNLGLLRAVEKFEPERGLRLVTYAIWWIRAAIHRYILENWSMVKLGTTQVHRKLFFSLRRARAEVARRAPDLERDEEMEEVAERLQVRPQDVSEMTQRLLGDASLETPVAEGGATLGEQFASPDCDPECQLGERQEQAMLASRVRAAVDSLEPRERYIVERRLMAEEPLTLVELGTRLGFSGARACQLEGRARRALGPALADLRPVVHERRAA